MISEMLLQELHQEIEKTKRTLERVPSGKQEFAPHKKSTPLGKLAPHVAQLTEFGLSVLTTSRVDFSRASFKPLAFESGAQLARVVEENAVKLRQALGGTTDEAWKEKWTLAFEGQVVFEGSRFLAYREMFLNHLVHHRAQLGVYLRLNDATVPATYGPSADEPF